MDRFLPLLCLCAAAVLITGCVNPGEPALVLPTMTAEPSPSPVPPTTPVPATTPVSPITSALGTIPDLNPRPTSIVPPLYHISIKIQKNPVPTNPWISVVYEGSPGRVLPSLVEATLIRSDGIIEQKSVHYPPRGTQILFNGTPAADRVIVNVTYLDGSIFTVKDELSR